MAGVVRAEVSEVRTNMALQHRLSDAVSMRLDREHQTNNPIIEIEFRFIRYRLVVDDKASAEKLRDLLNMTMAPAMEKKEAVELPKFYRNRKGDQI